MRKLVDALFETHLALSMVDGPIGTHLTHNGLLNTYFEI
jgi:hypothetical protein